MSKPKSSLPAKKSHGAKPVHKKRKANQSHGAKPPHKKRKAHHRVGSVMSAEARFMNSVAPVLPGTLLHCIRLSSFPESGFWANCRLNYATIQFQRLSTWNSCPYSLPGYEDPKGVLSTVVAEAAKHKTMRSFMATPTFWPSTRADLILMNPKIQRNKEHPQITFSAGIWSSPHFAWKMLAGQTRIQMGASGITPNQRLQQMLNDCCPGYDRLMLPRWTAEKLLDERGHVADLAFMAGVWRYSMALHACPACREEVFPPGIHAWPPTCVSCLSAAISTTKEMPVACYYHLRAHDKLPDCRKQNCVNKLIQSPPASWNKTWMKKD
jgi:hypothetical protein